MSAGEQQRKDYDTTDAPGVAGGAWSGHKAPRPLGPPKFGVPLRQQLRECEAKWSGDVLR